MDSGAARIAQQKDPRKVKIILGHKHIWSEVWDNNPRIARVQEDGDFNYIFGRHPSTNMRPYHKGKSEQRWVYNLDYRPTVGEIYLSRDEIAFGSNYKPQVVIEPNIKKTASPNKQYPFWQEFANLAVEAGYVLYQLGPKGTKQLNNAKLIQTGSFREACAVLSRATYFVGNEGGLHHAAAALGIKGVVVFGGFTPVELTGYPIHRNLGVSLDDACGMRVPCNHCKAEMAKIPPDLVLRQLKEIS